jgi:hypothetical protein
VVNLRIVRTAMLRQLRLLIACLLLAVAARPVVTALEPSRPVAVFVASAEARLARAASPRMVARTASVVSTSRARSVPVRVASAPAGPELTASETAPFRGTSPLYLTYERFLL